MVTAEKAAKTVQEEASSEATATEVTVALAMMEDGVDGVAVEEDPS